MQKYFGKYYMNFFLSLSEFIWDLYINLMVKIQFPRLGLQYGLGNLQTSAGISGDLVHP